MASATVTTVQLTLCLLVLGLVLGIAVALGQIYGPAPLRWLMSLYERFFRAMPILVLLILFYFGIPLLFQKLDLAFPLSPFASAALVFGLHSSAYQSQIFRGAIQSISQGQMLAARAMGLSRLEAIRYVILPQAFRLAIPAWSNEYSAALKDTSFAFTVGLVELTQQAQQIVNYNRQVFALFLAVAFIYLLLTTLGTRALGLLERRLRIPGFTMRPGGAHTHG